VAKRTLGKAALLALMVAVLLTGCVGGGEARTDSERVGLGGAESALVQIKMSAGGLVIRGGAEDLLEAEFTYNYDSWKPEVDYTVSGGEGLLTITHPSQTISFPGVDYEWDLRFNSEVPMEMQIDIGAGGGKLMLGGLSLRKLNIDLSVGGADIDLTGDWEADLVASIHGGVGGVNLVLPRDVGVRVEADAGLGGVNAGGFNQDGDFYTNDAYGQTDVSLEIRVEVGVGGVELSLRG